MPERITVGLELYDRFRLENEGYTPREINNACALLREHGETITVENIGRCIEEFRMVTSTPS